MHCLFPLHQTNDVQALNKKPLIKTHQVNSNYAINLHNLEDSSTKTTWTSSSESHAVSVNHFSLIACHLVHALNPTDRRAWVQVEVNNIKVYHCLFSFVEATLL